MVYKPAYLNSVRSSELLPLPVLPTRPTLLPPATSKLTPRSTSGRPGRYRTTRSRTQMAPAAGHRQHPVSVATYSVSQDIPSCYPLQGAYLTSRAPTYSIYLNKVHAQAPQAHGSDTSTDAPTTSTIAPGTARRQNSQRHHSLDGQSLGSLAASSGSVSSGASVSGSRYCTTRSTLLKSDSVLAARAVPYFKKRCNMQQMVTNRDKYSTGMASETRAAFP